MKKKLFTSLMFTILFLCIGWLAYAIKYTIDTIKKNQQQTIQWRQTIKSGDSVQVYSPIDKLRQSPTYGVVDSISKDSVYYIRFQVKKDVLYK